MLLSVLLQAAAGVDISNIRNNNKKCIAILGSGFGIV